jgi:transcription termination factor Rho
MPRSSRPDRARRSAPGPLVHDIGSDILGGVLDAPEGAHGRLRAPDLRPRPDDPLVLRSLIVRTGLRPGDRVDGVLGPAPGGRGRALLTVTAVNGAAPAQALLRPHFADLTAVYPSRLLRLASGPTPLSTRVIDLFCPLGYGQRALIVAPPHTGKTTLLEHIALAVRATHPAVQLTLLLIGERPEEVTHLRRVVDATSVVDASFDAPAARYTSAVELALQRAMRAVEGGGDAVVLVDSLTRLARAYNLATTGRAAGRTLSGGVAAGALGPARRLFGAARATAAGPSLTIVATCLVETGSRLDDVVFEEFKGTGNMELRLSRALAERRLYPGIDVAASGTRHEELLLDGETLRRVHGLRRSLAARDPMAGTELLLTRLRATPDNATFLAGLRRTGQAPG